MDNFYFPYSLAVKRKLNAWEAVEVWLLFSVFAEERLHSARFVILLFDHKMSPANRGNSKRLSGRLGRWTLAQCAGLALRLSLSYTCLVWKATQIHPTCSSNSSNKRSGAWKGFFNFILNLIPVSYKSLQKLWKFQSPCSSGKKRAYHNKQPPGNHLRGASQCMSHLPPKRTASQRAMVSFEKRRKNCLSFSLEGQTNWNSL